MLSLHVWACILRKKNEAIDMRYDPKKQTLVEVCS